MAEPIITLEGLTKRYGAITAVDDLTLSIHRGEVFGLLGPNGAGKTTTTLMLLGLSEPTKGKATINGIDCTREPIRVKQMAGYLPDNVGFYPDMTGRENLRMTGRMNGLKGKDLEERIDALLERVGMTDSADRKTGAYSKGMRQRLGIADILIKDPDVLIMDEPTNGIDPQGMRELITLIRELAEKDGKTILISSHQLYQIQQICDRVGIFVKGRLIACGRIDELGEQMEGIHGCTIELAAEPSGDKLEKFLRGQEGVIRVERSEEYWILHTRTDRSADLARKLVDGGYSLRHLRLRSSDLDEIYAQYFEKAGDSDADPGNARSGGKRKAGSKKRA
ncbi:MAG: ABC transporter ATP-binding protein [Aristaeellaceae bacterium]